MSLLSSLPASLTSISCGSLCHVSGRDLAHALSAAGALETLLLDNSFPPAEADLLLRGLPSLRRLSLQVYSDGGAPGNWRPALPPGLTLLQLQRSDGPFFHVDLSALAALPGLQELSVRALGWAQGMAALAQLWTTGG